MPAASRFVPLLGTFNQDGTVTGVTATQSSQPIQSDNRGLVTVFLRSVGATTGGTVLIEEADWGPLELPYSGTWSTVLSQAASGFTGGVQLAVHAPVAAFAWYRVRISSTITGGGSVLASGRDMSVNS
jgi:hypothetical protein